MKQRTILAIIATLFLVGVLLTAIPVKAPTGTINVGIFGPMRLIQGVGMLEGAQLAKEWIDAHPISIGGTDYTINLIPVDEALGNVSPEPTSGSGYAAMTWLLGQNPDLMIGGFRSEAVFGGLSKWKGPPHCYKLWWISGAATNHIIDCGGRLDPDGPLGPMAAKPCKEYGFGCAFCDYSNSKYIFRATPVNVTTLLTDMGGFGIYSLVPKLLPLYKETAAGPCQNKIRCAVIAESATWCDVLWDYMTTPGIYQRFLGPNAYVDKPVSARVAPDAASVTNELTAMDNAGVRLIVEILSGEVGRTVQIAHHDLGLKSVLFGINVVSQMSDTWDLTGGGCEYESFLATIGTRTPLSTTSVPYTTTQVWDMCVAHSATTVGGWSIFNRPVNNPIYTFWGAYQTIINYKTQLEAAGVIPPFNTKAKADALVPYFEKGEVDGVVGKTKLTGPYPMNLTAVAGPSFLVPVTKAAGVEYWRYAPFVENGNYTKAQALADALAAYAANHDTGGVNPTMKGTLHDLYSDEAGPYWTKGWVRSMVVQWQAGRHEVVFPTDKPYSKLYTLKDGSGSMYPYPSDVIENGVVDIMDALLIRGAFATHPGDLYWQLCADVVRDSVIDVFDALSMRADFGREVNIPLAYGYEANQWKS